MRLSTRLNRQLDKLSRATKRPKSKIVRRAARSELAVTRFRGLRKTSLPLAEAAGYLTDEDVFQALGKLRPKQKPRPEPA